MRTQRKRLHTCLSSHSHLERARIWNQAGWLTTVFLAAKIHTLPLFKIGSEPCLLYSYPCVSLHPLLYNQEHLKWWYVWLLRLGHKKHMASPLFLIRSCALGEASCHTVRTLIQPFGERYTVRNWGPHPTTNSLLSWKYILQSSFQMTQPQLTFIINLMRPLARTTQPSHSWTSDPLKLWNNKCILLF